MESNPNEEYEQFRNSSLYPILICGIILIVVGVILSIENMAAGWGFPVTSMSRMDSAKPIVSGPVCIGLGAVMSVFPVFQLIKNRKKKSK